jgi:DNA-binding response OmpR family regulator
MNLDSKIVTRNEQEIQLTAREFTLLEFFMRNPNKVLSRVDILEKVWGIHFDLGTNVIDVYVNYLRNKIDREFKEKLIHTMIGMGYVLKRT